jgi:hypothetical protein
MYYNLYHVSNLRKIVPFLCKIECIEIKCNKFVLVLVQIDPIKWRMDIDKSGYWKANVSNSPALLVPKTSKADAARKKIN